MKIEANDKHLDVYIVTRVIVSGKQKLEMVSVNVYIENIKSLVAFKELQDFLDIRMNPNDYKLRIIKSSSDIVLLRIDDKKGDIFRISDDIVKLITLVCERFGTNIRSETISSTISSRYYL